MKEFVEMQNVWDNPVQAAVMGFVCWYYSEPVGYASLSYGRLARLCGVERQYLMRRVMPALEHEKLALINLGPDPASQTGRTRWKPTLALAGAKVRLEAGVDDAVRYAALPRRKRRTRPRKPRGGGVPGYTRVGYQGSPGGDPGITRVGYQGSPQPSTGTYHGTHGSTTESSAAAEPSPSQADFQLTGETPDPIGREAKAARERNASKLHKRIYGYAVLLLERPTVAATFTNGAPLDTEADLIAATKAYCRYKRVAGYGEGRALVNACASAWHLRTVREALKAPAVPPVRRRRRAES